MASKVLQIFPCLARSVINQRNLNISVYTRNQFVKSATSLFLNRENGAQKRFVSTDANPAKDDEGKLLSVYNGKLTSQIRRVKIFSITTSLFGICAQPLIYNELVHVNNLPVILMACSIVGFFTFGTPFLLHYITKKYITHLDYNKEKDTYLATTINFWCINKQFEFSAEDVVVPDVPGMFTTLIAKGRPLFLDAQLFDDPSHYAKIMGYNKPMDFKLYETSANKSQKT